MQRVGDRRRCVREYLHNEKIQQPEASDDGGGLDSFGLLLGLTRNCCLSLYVYETQQRRNLAWSNQQTKGCNVMDWFPTRQLFFEDGCEGGFFFRNRSSFRLYHLRGASRGHFSRALLSIR